MICIWWGLKVMPRLLIMAFLSSFLAQIPDPVVQPYPSFSHFSKTHHFLQASVGLHTFAPCLKCLVSSCSSCDVCVCVCVCARAHLVVSDSFVTPRTVARQASLSAEFSKQEYCGELPFSTPGNIPNPGIELASLASPALTGRFFTTVPPGKPSPLLCGVQPSSSVIALLPSQITVHAFIINIIFYTLCAP